jgi:pimeloyl-ACP methyl ester carboxylesterase
MQKIKLVLLTKSIGFYLNCLSYINADKAKNIAYKLFSHPRKGKLKNEKLPKTLQSAYQETFEYKNEKFKTYRWQGDDQIILLVHGWESNASRWKKLLPYLKPLGKTIIAIDAPAHGLSEGSEFNAPKYAEFINIVSQRYQPKILIGHSIGGAAIAFYLNKFKTPFVEKVILLGSPSDFKIISNDFVKLLSLNTKLKNRLEAYYQEKFDIHIDDFAGHKFAENFTQKAFIAHDNDDTVVLVNEGRKYAKAWKNAIYIETKGLGHSMHSHELYQKMALFITS